MFAVEVGLILVVAAAWWFTSKAAAEEPVRPVPLEDPTTPKPELVRPPHGLVLFLDFDGVLHPGFSETFCHRDNLERILRANPTVDVVISSDWRRADFTYLQELFSDDVRERIIGRTGYMEGPYARHREIIEFCRAHSIGRWLALDDDEAHFLPGCPNLFLVDVREGLTEEAASRLVQRLNQLSEGLVVERK